MVELYHGVRLFTGKKNNDVLADVIKVLGVPTKDELVAMNAPIKDLKIPPIKTITFEEVVTQTNIAFPRILLCRWIQRSHREIVDLLT